MKQRCYNPNSDKFPIYGGRGITISEQWMKSPKSFIEWSFENGYKEGLQIDRENNNGNYEPNNCRFVTPKINSNNKRRSNVPISFNINLGYGGSIESFNDVR